MAVLHITNGAAVAADLRSLGEVLTWDDVLHEGPVPALEPAALREVRARFLADAGFTDLAQARARLAARDERLDAVDFSTRIVLWFEDDLYDQLQLLQILDRLAASAESRRSRPAGPVELVRLARGPRSFLRDRLAAARPLGEADHETRAAAVGGVHLPRSAAGAGGVAGRDAGAARRRTRPGPPAGGAPGHDRRAGAHRAPDPRRARRRPAAARRALHRGDRARGAPLPRRRDAVVARHAHGSAGAAGRPGVFALTTDGERVFAGEADATALLAPLDRWVGGVHHAGAPAVRWDPAARRLRR